MRDFLVVIAAIGAALASVPTNASSLPFPTYDVDGACRQVISHGVAAGSPQWNIDRQTNECIDREQQAYNDSQVMWNLLPDSEVVKCRLPNAPAFKFTYVEACLQAAYTRFDREHTTQDHHFQP